jgi:hypothetical protein
MIRRLDGSVENILQAFYQTPAMRLKQSRLLGIDHSQEVLMAVALRWLVSLGPCSPLSWR